MTYSYKQLTSSDGALLKELLKVFADAFEDPEAYQSKVPSDGYIRSFLSKEENIVLVALDESDVVGGLIAYVLQKAEQERTEVYLYDLAVAASHRRRGIAKALIEQLKKISKEHGAYVVYVQADKGDEPAIKLYESLGAKTDVYHFDIAVD